MQFPHCDPRVLHKPSECQYCDQHPDWQELRLAQGVAFSGHKPKPGQTPCPADQAVFYGQRGDYNQWYGNVAQPETPVEEGPPIGRKRRVEWPWSKKNDY